MSESKNPESDDGGESPVKRAVTPARTDNELMPRRSSDETDIGWGDEPGRGDDWYLDERPPHHGS